MAERKIFLKENRDRIEKKYREQVMGLPQAFAEIDKKLAECTDEVALACKYLYAFMPYSDIGNYAFEVFLDYAENGVYLCKISSAKNSHSFTEAGSLCPGRNSLRTF